jgi:hemoglobin-like flavoprotein
MDAQVQVSFAGAEHISASLEIAAERAGDLTHAIYARLFTYSPGTEPLFIMDRDGAVRGNMLSHAFNTILDFIGERRYAHNFIASEIVTHIAYDVPPDAFASFFTIMREEIRAACGPQWSPEMEDAWQRLLHDLERYVARPTHVA